MIIDSHCHLVSWKFDAAEIPELLSRATETGVSGLVTLATSLDDMPKNLAVAEAYSNVFSCMGIHPCDVHETPDEYLPTLEHHARHARCLAIGETGLDYYHPAPEGWTEARYHERQRRFLRDHFELAATLGKNIVIHTRDRKGHASFDDALAIYRDFATRVRAVFHCFLGPIERAAPVFELGGIVSFGGIATFKNAIACREAAIAAARGQFMLETDAPYLAPTPHRGKRNEPAYTRLTAEALAEARGESIETLAAHTTCTASAFYQIDFPSVLET